ncbi:DUF5675 family protein [Flavobacterium gawalongense]|uniref:DUF5675 domain-containing protein n=1 Tax=Flavobacterium gawalongense TaxID=2594432 RepID=A0A553BBF9_9FLAO|nr:DUF5675 family protein [Flavobacterium gawalongense]TRX01391.1 hypothetical protein FNW33_09775 [Flavobacterium gawalongense]TRX05580.1 hypothetical protein FNW11_15985 [Flavobacterium gawalongense]TRX05915.1 hypothetical protein FNW12_09860 [Flavobacterium gawalongense]TRX06421.1 hypothetical protein FNW10_16040 [Flavobacterium gawalongense]TRX22344.1 hypothetical protein FNW38_16080 [Flavobacterium gawalongense]
MVLVLNRTYFPEGTQGTLEWNGTLVCYTIELPWLNNQQRVSCIPEGKYVLQKRFSPKFQWHLHLRNVPGRDLILIHPANDAKTELLGCIGPVSKHTGIGKGSSSRKALEKLKVLVYDALDRNEVVKISIQSKKVDV